MGRADMGRAIGRGPKCGSYIESEEGGGRFRGVMISYARVRALRTDPVYNLR